MKIEGFKTMDEAADFQKWLNEPYNYTWSRKELAALWDALQCIKTLNENAADMLLGQISNPHAAISEHCKVLKRENTNKLQIFKDAFRLVELGITD